jgi:hypothetical protein
VIWFLGRSVLSKKKTEEGHYRLVDAGTDYGVGFDSMGNERRSMGPGRAGSK